MRNGSTNIQYTQRGSKRHLDDQILRGTRRRQCKESGHGHRLLEAIGEIHSQMHLCISNPRRLAHLQAAKSLLILLRVQAEAGEVEIPHPVLGQRRVRQRGLSRPVRRLQGLPGAPVARKGVDGCVQHLTRLLLLIPSSRRFSSFVMMSFQCWMSSIHSVLCAAAPSKGT